MTKSITKYIFVIPIGIIVFQLATQISNLGDDPLKHWFAADEVSQFLIFLKTGTWNQAWLHFKKAFTTDFYILVVMLILTLFGVKHFIHESRRQALAAISELEKLRSKSHQLGGKGLACCDSGQLKQAIAYYQRALEISRSIGDLQSTGRTLGNLGNAYQALGNENEAIRCHEQALSVFREIGDRRGEGSVLGNLGKAYSAMGQVDKAIQHNKQSLSIFEELRSPIAPQMRRWITELEVHAKRNTP